MFKGIVTQLVLSRKDKDISSIWNSFCRENLYQECVSRNVKFENKLLENATESEILKNVDLPDGFWQELFISLRDAGCKNVHLQPEQAIAVQCAGIERELTLNNLDENVLDDYGDICKTQTAIPDIMILEEDKKLLMEDLKRKYENSMKRKHNECQTREFLALLLESPEAQRLKAIQSKEAEYYVQDQLIKVCEKLNLPLVVLRGIQTYSNVGKHLTEFGIKLSKLR